VKKKILIALIAMSLLLGATPVLAATVYQETAPAAIDMVEPIQLTVIWPNLPTTLEPGTTLSWHFTIKNTSTSRGYWIVADVWYSVAEGSPYPWINSQTRVEGKGLETIVIPSGQQFYIPAGETRGVDVSLVFREDSPISKGLRFTPRVDRVMPPEIGGKG